MILRYEQESVIMKLKRAGKLDEYDLSFDNPIALRRGTKSYTKHLICNFVSYDNQSL